MGDIADMINDDYSLEAYYGRDIYPTDELIAPPPHKGRPKVVRCPYCKGKAELVGGNVIYPHRTDLHDRCFWLCRTCKAYVGCHKGPDCIPFGPLANGSTRAARVRAHAAFDPVWQTMVQASEGILTDRQSRKLAYWWLANEMNIPEKECHIGMFSVEQCEQVLNICRRREET